MCTHQRLITNRYTGRSFYVPCGHCKACQQAKALRRVTRIRNHTKAGYVALSVMLSYDRYAVPYIWRSDVHDAYKIANKYGFAKAGIKVFRDCQDRRVRVGSNYNMAVHREKKQVLLDEKQVTFKKSTQYDLPNDLVKGRGKIGVLYYKDIQDFNKRLRINLQRNFNNEGRYTYYAVGEYGSDTLRPHWHLLLFIKAQDIAVYRDAIRKSWTYGDLRKERRIEVAKNMASYVASYVNCGADFPAFLSENFPPKTHFSQGFGCGSDVFSLSSLLQKVERGDLSYNLPSKSSPRGFVSVQIPKYVVHRFFPLFKGYSRLSCSTVSNFLRTFSITSLVQDSRFDEIGYTFDDLHQIQVRLHNACERYIEVTGKTSEDFAIDHNRIWTCYRSNVLKRLHTSDDAPPVNERYDNLYEMCTDRGNMNRYLFGDLGFDFVEVNPNNFQSTIRITQQLTEMFDNNSKYKKINNHILSKLDEEF